MAGEQYHYQWTTAADWNAATNRRAIENEQPPGNGAIRLGRPYDHFVGAADEAYYRILNTSGLSIPDRSPAGNDGTTTGDRTNVSDAKFPTALVANGSARQTTFPTALWSTGTLLAFEAWLRPRQGGTGAHAVIDKAGMWALRWDHDTPQGFDVSTPNSKSGSIGPSGLGYDDWLHVNTYWDAGNNEIGMSVNNSQWDTVTVDDGMVNRDARVSFGGYDGGSDYFRGELAGARCISDRRIERAQSLYRTDGRLTTAPKP